MLRETMPVARAFSAALSVGAFLCMLIMLERSSVAVRDGSVREAEELFFRAVGLGGVGMVSGGLSMYIHRSLSGEEKH